MGACGGFWPDRKGFYLTGYLYFCNSRNMPAAPSKKSTEQVAKYADMLSAMGTELRLRIMHLPDLHRANEIAPRRVRMEGWRRWRLGGRKNLSDKKTKEPS